MAYLDPHAWYLYKYAGTLPPPQPAQTEYQAQYTVTAQSETIRLPHSLETANVVPCFTASWNTTVWPVAITDTYVDAKFSVPAPLKSATLDFSIARGTAQAVTAAATTATVSHNAGSITAVTLFAANWNTTFRITSKSANTTVLSFSVPAQSGAFLYWASHADDSDFTSVETVSSGAETHTVVHSAARAFLPIFLVPYWNTTFTWSNKAELDQTTIKFGTPPSGSQSMDTRIKAVGNLVIS